MDPTVKLLNEIVGHLTAISGRLDRLESRMTAMDVATGTEFRVIDERFRDFQGYMETMAGWHKDHGKALEYLAIKATDTENDPILQELVSDYLAGAGGEELRLLHVSMIRERLAIRNAEQDEGDEWKGGGD